MVDHIVARFFQDGGSSRSNAQLINAGYIYCELYQLNIWPISTRLSSNQFGLHPERNRPFQ